jgi:2-polyprenyl-3-methyl-5-hydroxy-6-metoxy-1,4-benzoquinol methylase
MINVVCNLCNQDNWRLRFPATLNGAELDVASFRCTSPHYGDHAQIVQCRNCGLVYANPRWDSDVLLQAYSAVEDETYQRERVGRELTFARHLRALEQRTGPANGRSLLDVGAYVGVFVEAAAASGWDAWGVEPSSWAASEAQKHGLKVLEGTLDSPELEGRRFDIVTMWDVIEHFGDPSAELRKVRQRLKPGGWLVVHTMDIDSPLARVMGQRWPWLMDMHLYYFSQKSLARMLVNHGFSVVWSGAQGRYLRLRYLTTRIGGLNRHLGRMSQRLVNGLRLGNLAVPINLGDLFTVYARRSR